MSYIKYPYNVNFNLLLYGNSEFGCHIKMVLCEIDCTPFTAANTKVILAHLIIRNNQIYLY